METSSGTTEGGYLLSSVTLMLTTQMEDRGGWPLSVTWAKVKDKKLNDLICSYEIMFLRNVEAGPGNMYVSPYACTVVQVRVSLLSNAL